MVELLPSIGMTNLCGLYNVELNVCLVIIVIYGIIKSPKDFIQVL